MINIDDLTDVTGICIEEGLQVREPLIITSRQPLIILYLIIDESDSDSVIYCPNVLAPNPYSNLLIC